MLTWDGRKRPDATLDYYFDAGPWIEPVWPGSTAPAETVTSLVAVVTAGTATITSQTPIGGMLQMIFAGGAAGEVTQVEITMVTSKGRTYTETVRLRIGG